MRRSAFLSACLPACLLALSLALAPLRASAGDIPLEEPKPKPKNAPSDSSHSHQGGKSAGQIFWMTVAYLPNRLFDLTDIVRMQVRAGPGWALSARATRLMPLYVGDYTASWIGLPGPRKRARVPLPLGIESQRGVGIGPAFTGGGSQAPTYGDGEIGAGVHAYMLGFDVGFDVVELVDFFAGFACEDIQHDDF